MSERIQFKKGKQRKFLDEVMQKLSTPSLRSLKQFGINTKYSTLKNYHNEARTLPQELFEDICHIAKINPKNFEVKTLEENWGQIKGGKKGKRK